MFAGVLATRGAVAGGGNRRSSGRREEKFDVHRLSRHPGLQDRISRGLPRAQLGGQHAAYIQKALQEYKAGNRSHPTMRAIAAGLTDKDMADLAAYYGAEAPKTAAK